MAVSTEPRYNTTGQANPLLLGMYVDFKRMTPTMFQRHCVLQGPDNAQALATSSTAHLDVEVLRWIESYREPISRIIGIAINALVAIADGTPVAAERQLARKNIGMYNRRSKVFATLIRDCAALAEPFTDTTMTDAEFIWRMRIIWLAFDDVDPSLEIIYKELHPQNDMHGEQLHAVIREWMYGHLNILLELSSILNRVTEKNDGIGGTVAAVRQALTDELTRLSPDARSLIERSATMRRALPEPHEEDEHFMYRLNALSNTLIA